MARDDDCVGRVKPFEVDIVVKEEDLSGADA